MITYARLGHNRTNLAAFGILTFGCVLCVFIHIADAQGTQQSRADSLLQSVGSTQLKKSAAHLYFADRDSYYLISEQRVITHTEDAVDFARSIVEAIIKGPKNPLVPTVVPGTELRAIYIIPAGVCYVDLSPAVKEKHPGGCNSELLTIYSVVNSLILNIPEIKSVKLLIGGKEVRTLAGHIDLEFPLEADMLLIR